MGAHGNCRGGDTQLLPVHEVAMLGIMDKLTDKPDWHKKVFDETIVAKWRQEALAIPDKVFWDQVVTGAWPECPTEIFTSESFGYVGSSK